MLLSVLRKILPDRLLGSRFTYLNPIYLCNNHNLIIRRRAFGE